MSRALATASPVAASSPDDPFECYPGDVRDAWKGSLFSEISPESTRALLESAVELDVPAGEEVSFPFDESERVSGVGRPGLVIDGLVRTFVSSACGRRQVTVQYARTADFCEVPPLTPGSEAAQTRGGCQAIVDTRMLLFSPAAFYALMQSDSKLAPAFATGLLEVLHASVSLMAENVLWPLRQRVARHLLDLAVRESGRLMVPATVQDIADATGTIREVVTRLLKAMRAEGLITREDGKLVICDARALHLVARGELPTSTPQAG